MIWDETVNDTKLAGTKRLIRDGTGINLLLKLEVFFNRTEKDL